MKQRFNKLLAILLTASLCVPMLPAAARAADSDIYFTEKESISVSTIGNERFSNFNEGWKFNLGDSNTAQNTDFNDAGWSEVKLPHDFSIFQEFTTSGEAESGFLPGGTGWYRKTFTVPENLNGKSIVLNFDGVYSEAYVYVNGRKVGEHHYGYTTFAFDITEYLTCDGRTENLIAVKAVNNVPSSRWYSGSGIYRDVTLIITDPVHVARNGTAVTTPNIQNGTGTVNVAVDVTNDSNAQASVTVRNTVYDSEKKAVSSPAETTVSVSAGATVAASAEATVSNPALWSIEDPNMYFVRTELLVNNKVVDTYDTDFGFRWFAFDHDTGFSLNGTNVKLNGVCMHHDQGALGSAAYYDAMYRQLSILKDMGVNAVRITHNPADEQYLEICNKLGLLAVEEFFDGWHIAKNGNTYDFSRYFNTNITSDNEILDGNSSMTWAEYTLKSTVKRDRNNPCLIMWSLGNEISEGCYVNSEQFPVIARNLVRWIQEEDSSRLPTAGDNRRDEKNGQGVYGYSYVKEVNEILDAANGVVGFNYATSQALADLHSNYKYIVASETASAVNSRSVYKSQQSQANADGKWHLTSYDTSKVGWGKTAQNSMWDTITADYVAGQFVWTGFDYIGEPTPKNGIGTGSVSGLGPIPNSSYFGIVETTGFPKDSYYLYRSQWNHSDTTLHLVTAWDSDNMMYAAGNKTPVWIYSNAPTVKLYRNGTEIATATGTEHTTDAGHKYYTYRTESKNTSVCSAVNGSNAASLYAVFNVAFEEGTISAKAFDANGNEIKDVKGNASVSTPDAVSKLILTQDKTEITSDGCSLAYITVDVTDDNGTIDTLADNEIHFSLEGNGEIVGVDNGDQATVDKYQQPSVLESTDSAKINAYAGKALVIVRSTKDSGSFTVTASSNGLTGSSVTVATAADAGTGEKQLSGYMMSKHCYVPTGSSDIALPSSVEALYTDGSSQSVPITWEAYDKSNLAQNCTFQINGSFTDGKQTIRLFITAHVYDPIGGVKGFSVYTQPNIIPSLPSTAMAYYKDGSEFEECPVTWDMSGITSSSLAEAGTIVTVNGTVRVLDKTYPTTATIRVASGELSGQKNVAPAKEHLTDNGPYSDVLTSIIDGNRTDNGTSSSRWSNWDEWSNGQHTEHITISMDWATAISTNQINLFFFKENKTGSALPTNVKFEYGLNSNWNAADKTIDADWIEIGYAEPESISLSGTAPTQGFSYKLDQNINPVSLRITFEHAQNTYIGLNEVEVISPNYTYHPNTSASIDGATCNGVSVAFDRENATYEVNAGFVQEIIFDNKQNASLTFIHETDEIVKVISVSEDGNETKTYTLKLTNTPTEESKQALQSRLNELKALDSSLYTADSYKKLQDLIAQFENAIDKTSETQLRQNLEALNAAYAQLVKASVPTPTPDPTPTPTPTPTPGTQIKVGDAVTLKGVQYKVLDTSRKTVAIVKNTNPKATKVTIPASVKVNGVSCNVTQIGANAFKGAKNLKSVVIGKNVTLIGKKAFFNCKKLKKVTFKGTAVKKIKSGAFKKTNAKITVNVPKKMKKKQRTAFKKKLTGSGMSKKLKLK